MNTETRIPSKLMKNGHETFLVFEDDEKGMEDEFLKKCIRIAYLAFRGNEEEKMSTGFLENSCIPIAYYNKENHIIITYEHIGNAWQTMMLYSYDDSGSAKLLYKEKK